MILAVKADLFCDLFNGKRWVGQNQLCTLNPGIVQILLRGNAENLLIKRVESGGTHVSEPCHIGYGVVSGAVCMNPTPDLAKQFLISCYGQLLRAVRFCACQ